MKILFLSFYYEPDLCAGSFRNTALAKKLSAILGESDSINVITTIPNRYNSFATKAKLIEKNGNLVIHRINIPLHKNNFIGQIKSFGVYYFNVLKLVKKQRYDIVFASSSRLFTAFLGARVSSKLKSVLYLDIRDIFTDTIADVIKSKTVKFFLIPVLRLVEKYAFNKANHINLVSEGFRTYFSRYESAKYSFFTNGIDNEFLNIKDYKRKENEKFVILYAGNIGEGQGLDKIVPLAAKMLGDNYRFIIIGDGGTKKRLQIEIESLNVKNVDLLDPIERDKLMEFYINADFLFMHLNDYEAFKKVLPSKIFEYGAFDKPIIAGVSGYSRKFIKDNLENVILFDPGDVESMVNQVKNFKYFTLKRNSFVERFSRDSIMTEMSHSIIDYS